MKLKPIFAFLILMIPVAFLGGVYFLVGEGSYGSPRWTVDRSGLSVASCDAAGERVSNPPAVQDTTADVQLSSYKAGQRADKILAKLDVMDGKPGWKSTTGPVKATLPDGSERYVWARVWVKNWTYNNNNANGAVLYIDGSSGDPLVLYTNVTVVDPTFASGCQREYDFDYDYESGIKSTLRTAFCVLSGIGAVVGFFIYIAWKSVRRY